MLHVIQLSRFLIKAEDGRWTELWKLQQFPEGQGIISLRHWTNCKEQMIKNAFYSLSKNANYK